MWDYRGERWWPLLTSILETSLKCAYLTAKVQDYVINCIELIGPCILFYISEIWEGEYFLDGYCQGKASGPSCSKLTTSFVNAMFKFQLLISEIYLYFLLKNMISFCNAKASHILSTKKHQCILALNL